MGSNSHTYTLEISETAPRERERDAFGTAFHNIFHVVEYHGLAGASWGWRLMGSLYIVSIRHISQCDMVIQTLAKQAVGRILVYWLHLSVEANLIYTWISSQGTLDLYDLGK